MMCRRSVPALRAGSVLAVALCTSCVHPPASHPGSGSGPGRPVGRPGCGPPISYQVFQKDAFGADWSKANDLLAYNAKGRDDHCHIYTVKPDVANPAQFADNSYFYGDVETNLLNSDSVIARVALTCHGS